MENAFDGGYETRHVMRVGLGCGVPAVCAQGFAGDGADGDGENSSEGEQDAGLLRGVARGRSNKIIAEELAISEHTVKNHLKSILSKLNADDRTHAVTLALERGILPL